MNMLTRFLLKILDFHDLQIGELIVSTDLKNIYKK